MVLSDDGTADVLGALRIGFVALLAPLWLLGGVVLIWVGETVLGVGAVGVGLVMILGGYRLYRAIDRPDVVVDERTRATQHRAGYNGFWTMVLVPMLAVSFSPFVPAAVASTVAAWGGLTLAWPVALACGCAVYLASIAYYRRRGLG